MTSIAFLVGTQELIRNLATTCHTEHIRTYGNNVSGPTFQTRRTDEFSNIVAICVLLACLTTMIALALMTDFFWLVSQILVFVGCLISTFLAIYVAFKNPWLTTSCVMFNVLVYAVIRCASHTTIDSIA